MYWRSSTNIPWVRRPLLTSVVQFHSISGSATNVICTYYLLWDIVTSERILIAECLAPGPQQASLQQAKSNKTIFDHVMRTSWLLDSIGINSSDAYHFRPHESFNQSPLLAQIRRLLHASEEQHLLPPLAPDPPPPCTRNPQLLRTMQAPLLVQILRRLQASA